MLSSHTSIDPCAVVRPRADLGALRRGGPAESNADKLSEKGAATMKLTTLTMVTVDGVMQGLGGADEDRRGGFERGGWVASAFDNEADAVLNQVYQRADAFLVGRRTYEIFARPWGVGPD